jgi:hypothetical protein
MGRGRSEQTRIRIRRGGGISGKIYLSAKPNPLLLSENDGGSDSFLLRTGTLEPSIIQ